MTSLEILNDAGSDGDHLADGLSNALSAAAPMVEQISGLSLPPRVTVRLATPEASRALSVLHVGRVYGTAAERLATRETFDIAKKIADTPVTPHRNAVLVRRDGPSSSGASTSPSTAAPFASRW
ncbi:hypothetical protein [Kitasatospora sp. NPDC127116]|uniref:hypothetical protein n=1 Tax=Kitasatospora sp. NPDC127116 TaxID=3345367 RepID=UPI003629B0AA